MPTASNHVATHKLGPLGAEPELSEMGQMVQQTVHRFAEEVMRPAGVKLDRMTPEEAIAPGSPYWEARKKYVELGFGVDGLLELEPAERANIMCILFEELGWGDSGLAISYGAGLLPALMSAVLGNPFCRALAPDSKLGCWAITEPDHGSDSLDANGMILHPQGTYGRPNCVATLRGDDVIINGQKSAWVSNGIVADVCILYCAADSGAGVETKRGAVIIVPMDAKGVSRGKPLDKVGQRALNQGEIFFENVKLSKDHILAGPDQYLDAVYAIHTRSWAPCSPARRALPSNSLWTTRMNASRAGWRSFAISRWRRGSSICSGRLRRPVPWRAVSCTTTSRRRIRRCMQR
jgi:acyl-CoA dehydrogenase